MIGTLTRYELKKSVWNKFFLIIFALLLLANVLLNCGIQDFLNWMDAVENGTALGEITAENTNFWGNKAEIRPDNGTNQEAIRYFCGADPGGTNRL